MAALFEQVGALLGSKSPAPRLSSFLSHSLKSETNHVHTSESSEYWQDHRSRAGTPFESESSNSDCSSDSGDEPLFEMAMNPSPTVPEPWFPSDVFRFNRENIDSVGESNALGLEFMSEGVILGAQAVATSIPQAESLQAPPNHQDARSCDRPNYKHQAHQAHSAPQPGSPADKTLAGRRPQDIGLQDEVSDASGLKKFQVWQRAHTDPGPRKSYGDDNVQDWSNTGYTGQLEGAATVDGVSTHAVDTLPRDWEVLRAPRMRTIPLPGEGEGDDDLLYSGPGLDGWLNCTFDGVPETIPPGRLDFDVPVPFAMEV